MGFVYFQSRIDNHREILHHMLGDLDDEEMPGMQTGDIVIFKADIDSERYAQLSNTEVDGLKVHKKPPTPAFVKSGFVAEIEFVIKKRVHVIRLDRKTCDHCFRADGVTIYLEAVSDAGENLFVSLQKDLSE